MVRSSDGFLALLKAIRMNIVDSESEIMSFMDSSGLYKNLAKTVLILFNHVKLFQERTDENCIAPVSCT